MINYLLKNIFTLTNLCILIFIIIVILIILKAYIGKTYYSFYPGLPIYPNNKTDVEKAKKYIKLRTKEDVEFFYKTNKSVAKAFIEELNESEEEIDKICDSVYNIILLFKYIFNRARPAQIDSTIKPINTDTAKTPSFPSGHAFQAYYVSKYYSKKYPEKEKKLRKIAKECDLTRIKAGLHYPSDGQFSELLVKILF
tara:strand:- start:704 stop:1294 length:591 start_codon:yes stop_codon:yes gene_type:complete